MVAAVAISQAWFRRRPVPVLVMVGISVVLTLGLLAWSISQFGV